MTSYSPSATPKIWCVNGEPQPRVPTGANLLVLTMRLAISYWSATVTKALSKLTALWHMGVMIPWAPLSRARLIIQDSSEGIRMMGLICSAVMCWQSWDVNGCLWCHCLKWCSHHSSRGP